MSSPDRGEVWLVDLGYVAKVRPCLVISIPPRMQDRDLVTLIPHTTALRGSRFEVDVRVRFLKPGAFDVQNLITVPHAKLLRKLGELDSDQLL
ncbi:type II toxin-antitoxin system PemK/MazF family toxin [Leptolyngbya sp. KIOST-1]|uniref:type II toxin-antitoxin system PemK/MazF family toxin n=1 Tax=Leptolyngbya sp. KIOST-1 TaxID=1229172 RepID=UPI000907D487